MRVARHRSGDEALSNSSMHFTKAKQPLILLEDYVGRIGNQGQEEKLIRIKCLRWVQPNVSFFLVRSGSVGSIA
jgi:hypothetical protein